jgi:multisubunit Na+/H+ antiporter MnhG subunit
MDKMKATANQAKDTGLAMILILLLIVHFGEKYFLILPAIAVLVLTMTWPAAFRPLAWIWFKFSHFLGSIVSRILLTIIFFVVATPVGLMMRLAGKDAMSLKTWKDGQGSAFTKRDHTFTREELERPY